MLDYRVGGDEKNGCLQKFQFLHSGHHQQPQAVHYAHSCHLIITFFVENINLNKLKDL